MTNEPLGTPSQPTPPQPMAKPIEPPVAPTQSIQPAPPMPPMPSVAAPLSVPDPAKPAALDSNPLPPTATMTTPPQVTPPAPGITPSSELNPSPKLDSAAETTAVPSTNIALQPVAQPPIDTSKETVTAAAAPSTTLSTVPSAPDTVPPAVITTTTPVTHPSTSSATPTSSGNSGNGNSSQSTPPVKKSSSPLKYVIPLIFFFLLSVGGGVALMLSGQRQDNRNQASSVTSIGEVNQVTCGQVRGWVCDSANFAQPLEVAVYYDTFAQENLVAVGTANINRVDVAEQCGGTTAHGFTIDLPANKIPGGDHRLIVKGIPFGASGALNPADMFDIPLADTSQSFNVTCGNSSSVCTVGFTATEVPSSEISCTKETFQDELSNISGQYNYLQRQTNFTPGEVVVFRIQMINSGEQVQTFNLTDVMTESNLNQLEFIDTSCGTYDPATRTINYTSSSVNAGESITCGFRTRVSEEVSEAVTITNTAHVTAGSLTARCVAPLTVNITEPSPSPSPSVSPSPSPEVSPSPSPEAPVCGDSCSSNADCPNDHSCSESVCRLTACVNGASCTDNQCQLLSNATPSPAVTPVPTPTTTVAQASPAVGCNQSCETNADCSASSHICADTANGRRCRLDSNISSTTCTPAGEVAIVESSPEVIAPQELPVAGSNDILKAIGVGATAVILGVVGLLLL